MADFSMQSGATNAGASATAITVLTNAGTDITIDDPTGENFNVKVGGVTVGTAVDVQPGVNGNEFIVGVTGLAITSASVITLQYTGNGTLLIRSDDGELLNGAISITNNLTAGGGSAPSPSRLSIGIGGGL